MPNATDRKYSCPSHNKGKVAPKIIEATPTTHICEQYFRTIQLLFSLKILRLFSYATSDVHLQSSGIESVVNCCRK